MAEGAEPDSLGARIRRLRHERRLSLAKVCEGEFSRAFLNQVELGRSQPSTRVLRIIAARLGTGIEYLVEGEPETVSASLAIELGRVAVAMGRHQRALRELRPALAEEWPEGHDARVTQAAALRGLGRAEEAEAILLAEMAIATEHADETRRLRITVLKQGGTGALSAIEYIAAAERAVRAGRPADAADHYRSARLLLEAASDREPAGEQGAGDAQRNENDPDPRIGQGGGP